MRDSTIAEGNGTTSELDEDLSWALDSGFKVQEGIRDRGSRTQVEVQEKDQYQCPLLDLGRNCRMDSDFGPQAEGIGPHLGQKRQAPVGDSGCCCC